jgi:hypothetical protein
MTCHDVFNGDADGLCALHPLRLAALRHGNLYTNPKRDVHLAARVDAGEGNGVTVLDISLDVNGAARGPPLARNVGVARFHQHHAGEAPAHARLSATIGTAPDVGTSIRADRHPGGCCRAWASVSALDDNLRGSTERLATSTALAGALAGELPEYLEAREAAFPAGPR